MKTQSQLQPGSTVRLKSGGPEMKIVGVAEKVLRVEWSDDDNKMCFDLFPSTSLTEVR